MFLPIMLGNALRRDRLWLPLPVAGTIMRAPLVYLLTLIEGGGFGKEVWPKIC